VCTSGADTVNTTQTHSCPVAAQGQYQHELARPRRAVNVPLLSVWVRARRVSKRRAWGAAQAMRTWRRCPAAAVRRVGMGKGRGVLAVASCLQSRKGLAVSVHCGKRASRAAKGETAFASRRLSIKVPTDELTATNLIPARSAQAAL
jgi:hypothetical protein